MRECMRLLLLLLLFCVCEQIQRKKCIIFLTQSQGNSCKNEYIHIFLYLNFSQTRSTVCFLNCSTCEKHHVSWKLGTTCMSVSVLQGQQRRKLSRMIKHGNCDCVACFAAHTGSHNQRPAGDAVLTVFHGQFRLTSIKIYTLRKCHYDFGVFTLD